VVLCPVRHHVRVGRRDYEPKYKLYVTTQGNIAADTTIQMQSISTALSLGSAQTFNSDGSFVSGGVANVPADSLGLFNNRPAGTPPLTVGLAGLVNTPSGGPSTCRSVHLP
jgi:hypothetical protein